MVVMPCYNTIMPVDTIPDIYLSRTWVGFYKKKGVSRIVSGGIAG